MNVFITGGTGFIGRALVADLLIKGCVVSALVRVEQPGFADGVKQVMVKDIISENNWPCKLKGIDVVIHLAGRAHMMKDSAPNPLEQFRLVNTRATLELAKQAAKVGAKRFVFISSIKVNGEVTEKGVPFQPEDKCLPHDPYALSKYEAEQGLLLLAKETGMEVVIIRPPLVYGPGVRANFASMITWVQRGLPLPFGAINNRRSLLALDNLVSFIGCCIQAPKAANEVFLVADAEDLSTTELLQKVSKVFGRKSCLLAIPVSWLTCLARLLGKGDVMHKLCDSLQVDSSKAEKLLGWEPVVTMDEALKKTVGAYLNEKII